MFHADPHAGNVRLVVDPTAPGGAKPVLLAPGCGISVCVCGNGAMNELFKRNGWTVCFVLQSILCRFEI